MLKRAARLPRAGGDGLRRAFLLVACSTVLASFAPAPAASASGGILILAFEADTYVTDEPDETVVLLNPGAADVSLAGWGLQDADARTCTSAEGQLVFPAGSVLRAGAAWVITGNATAYERDHAGPADWEWLVDSDPAVPQLERDCGRFRLGNDVDEVVLVDAAGARVDAVVYGGVERTVAGWSGLPLSDPNEGLVHERDRPESGGPRPDTDTAADWDDLRVTMIGQSHWNLETFDDLGAVTACSSPDSSFETVAGFVRGARTSLDIEVYEWTNPHLADAFLDALDAGVAVRALLEGGPAGILDAERDQENWVLSQLVDRGADVRFMVTNATQTIHDRYDFVHTKMAIRDGRDVLVMSGNWKPTGLPTDDTFGNREWCLVVESVDLAADLADVFEDDRNAAEYRDVLTFGDGDDARYHPPPDDFQPDLAIPAGPYPPLFPAQTFDGTNARVTPILSPDTSLLQEPEASLIHRIRNAEREVLVEQMTLHRHWGPTACGDPCLDSDPSPLLDAVVAAARAGARVRVLLGHEFIDDEDLRNNRLTRDHLDGLAASEGLDLDAKIIDAEIAEILKVHNKGVLIDDTYTYVGSLNWGRNSAQENREVGLLLEHPDVAAFLEEIFWYDWNPPEFKPLTNLRADNVTLLFDAGLAAPDPLSLTPAEIVVNVTNTAARGAGDHSVEVRITPAVGPPALLTARVPHVRAGETEAVSLVWQPTVALGRFHLAASVDVRDEVRETNEADNTVSGVGEILAPVPGLFVDADVN